MDFEKLNKIASDLEEAHLPNSAFGVMESKDILAIVQAYRILSAKAELTNENSGLHLQRVKPRTFDPEFDEVECHYYELEQGTEDNTETCHLGLEIECCTHCYMNKALYGA